MPHATCTPGVLKSLDEVLTITVDDPTDAKEATLVLTELDHWMDDTGPSVERFGGDATIGSLTGKIVKGRFIVERIFDAQKVPKDSPELKVRVDGSDKIIKFRIPSDANEPEGGAFEIGLSLLVKSKAGTEEYDTPRPVLARRLIADRPVVTFMTGRDDDRRNPFFESARTYWRQYSDVAQVERFSLETILQYIRTENPRGKTLPWGEINIVTHGADIEDRSDGPGKMSALFFSILDGRANHVSSFVAGDLAKARPKLTAPNASRVDNETIVVLRGCEVGDDPRLLNEVRLAFGGKARVFAPRLIQTYRTQTQTVRVGRRRTVTTTASETFAEYFWIQVPGRRSPPDVPARGVRGPTVLELLIQKYGDSDPSSDQFRAMLRQRFPNRRESTQGFTFTGGANRTVAETLDDARKNFATKSEDTQYAAFDDYQWVPQRSGGVVVLNGSRRFVSVHRPVLLNGAAVTPNVLNPNHYGESPETVPPRKSKRTP